MSAPGHVLLKGGAFTRLGRAAQALSCSAGRGAAAAAVSCCMDGQTLLRYSSLTPDQEVPSVRTQSQC